MAFSQGRKLLLALSKQKQEKIKNPPVTSVSSLTRKVLKESKSTEINTQQEQQEDAVSVVSDFTPDELSFLDAKWVEKNVKDNYLPQASSLPEVSKCQKFLRPQISKVKQWLFRDDSADRSGSSVNLNSNAKHTSVDPMLSEVEECLERETSNIDTAPEGGLLTPDQDERGRSAALNLNAKCTSVNPQLFEVVECLERETSNIDTAPEEGLVTPEQVTHHDQLAPGHHLAEKLQTEDITVTPEETVQAKSQQGSKVKKALFLESTFDRSGNFSNVTGNTNDSDLNALTEDIVAAGINPLEGFLVLPLDGPAESEEVVIEVLPDSDPAGVNYNVLQLNEVIEDVIIETDKNGSETNQDENGNNVKKRNRQAPSDDKTPPKKRKIVHAKWKATIAKEAYNSGIAHVTLRGKERPARAIKPGCGVTCKRGCMHKITEKARQIQFEKYWNSKSKAAQWLMLAKLVSVLPVKRRRVVIDDGDSAYRKHSYEYHLPDENGKYIPVCQTTFLNTFDISIKTVRSALLKNSPDKRGKHDSRKNKLSEALVDSVKTHIKSFPVVESHYCRVDSRRKYLDEGLNVAKMHRLYLMQHDESDPDTATLRQYRDIFNSNFNLGFFQPKKDQCAVCSQWNGLSEEEKLAHPEKSAEIDEHLKNKKIVREMKRQDKADSRDEEKNPNLNKVRVITFDLQKVFLTPRSEVGEFFYKRKISSYNFTVFDCTTKEAHCYCWDQTIGDRGANEITSCIYMYITYLVSKGVTEIIIYSDSCSAQNKNQFLFSMYHWISIKHNVKIIHRYLEKGHTQMEADNVHARIEKKVKNQNVYVPQQWYGLIRCARVKKPHYVVKEVTQNDILNMKELGEHFQWSKIPISKIREIAFDGNFPRGHISFKKNLENESTVVNVLKNKPGRPVNWVTLRPPKPVYSEKRPMKKKLKDDLEWFVKNNYIPAPFVERFRALFDYESHEDQEVESDVDTPEEVTPEHALGEHHDDETDVPEDDVADRPAADSSADNSTDSETYD